MSRPPALGLNASGLGLALATVLACSDDGQAASYRTAPVERRDVVETVEATGRLEARDVEVVTASVRGRLAKVEVEAGQRVEAGEILAQLDTARLTHEVQLARAAATAAHAEVRKARIALEQARRERARTRRLAQRGQASQAQRASAESRVGTAEAAREAARAEHARARARLEEAKRARRAAELRAPRDAVVLSVPRRTGAAVSPEGPILFLLSAPLDVLWLEAPVGEADIGRLRVGQASRFEVQAFPGEVLPATIEQIGVLGDVEGSVARYPVRLTAPNPRGRLRPGMSAAVRFAVAEETKALAVREVALRFEPPGAPEAPPRSRVFVRTEPGRLEPVEVEAGISDGVYAVVTPVEDGALEPGDEVAIGLGTLNGHGRGPGLSLGGK